jgi:hypothetical protein
LTTTLTPSSSAQHRVQDSFGPAGARWAADWQTLSAPQGFPPRNETAAFRQELEQVYRVDLGRPSTTNFFDVHGDAVWTSEYLRYRVFGCDHLVAVQRVFDQIDRGVVAPVCAQIQGSRVTFPPTADSREFRQRLDAKYRDELRRSPSPTFVDAEGAVWWMQTYLRYRVFACDDETARAAVRTMIRGGADPSYCYTTERERDVMGHWSGTIAMPSGRPFTMDITTRRDHEYFGTYRDIAFGAVTLNWDGGTRVSFFVYFGDGAAWFEGQFIAPDRVRGSMRYDKIASRFDFDMTRDWTPAGP